MRCSEIPTGTPGAPLHERFPLPLVGGDGGGVGPSSNFVCWYHTTSVTPETISSTFTATANCRSFSRLKNVNPHHVPSNEPGRYASADTPSPAPACRAGDQSSISPSASTCSSRSAADTRRAGDPCPIPSSRSKSPSAPRGTRQIRQQGRMPPRPAHHLSGRCCAPRSACGTACRCNSRPAARRSSFHKPSGWHG